MGGMKLFGKRVLVVLLGVFLTLAAGSCVLAVDTAAIQCFSADKPFVHSGEIVRLGWDVSGAVEIRISGIEKETEQLPLLGSLEVWPMATTTYVLTAIGLDGIIVSKSVTVNVDVQGELKIAEFNASATQVLPGQTVWLHWKVSKGVKIQVYGPEKFDEMLYRTEEDTMEVFPDKTTTYLLVATGCNGEVASAALTVNVKTVLQPRIDFFKASATEVMRGSMVTLSWNTENAVTCTLETSDGIKLRNRKPNGSITITPNKTKTYTLVAYTADGTETRSQITVTVK